MVTHMITGHNTVNRYYTTSSPVHDAIYKEKKLKGRSMEITSLLSGISRGFCVCVCCVCVYVCVVFVYVVCVCVVVQNICYKICTSAISVLYT